MDLRVTAEPGAVVEYIAGAPREVPALLESNSSAISALNDRIDLLFERTRGIRVAKPEPEDAMLNAKRPETGAYIVDELASQSDRLWMTISRLGTLLSELEV